jgi:MtN3 and saliva related transmembrane protein
MSPEPIGWLSSCVLLVTLVIQVRKQWREHTSRGLSPWLYVGQLLASTGFLVYSALVSDAVFVATNALLMVVNVSGLLLVRMHHKRASR